jgi:hypothetical protein
MKKQSVISLKLSLVLVLTVLLLAVGSQAAMAASINLTKTVFSPTESITLSFTADSAYPDSAWIGIIPSNVAHGSESTNDGADMAYQYINKKASGTMIFTAPTAPGSYDFRMNDNDGGGTEVASVSFTVQLGADRQSSLSLNKTTFAPGEDIIVTFEASAFYSANAWVGIIPSNIAHGGEGLNDQNDLSYQYINKRTSGTMTFKAPNNAGAYDFRMNENDFGGIEITSVSFTIAASTGGTGTTNNTGASFQNLRAATANGAVTLTWNASSAAGVTGYNLYRGTYSGGEDSNPITDFPISGTSYTDENVENGTTYYYIMKPVFNDNSTGEASNEASATPGTAGKVIVLQLGNKYMTVNGISQEIDPGRGTTPITVQGRTLVPIRAIIEAMGGTIAWNGTEQKVTLNLNGKSIELWIGSKNTKVNGVNKITDVAPQIIGGRTMLPLRFVTENFGCNVDWDGVTQKVTIKVN